MTRLLHDMEVDEYLADSVEVDDLDLDGELRRVAADLAYWNAQHAAAVRVHLRAKIATKQVRGRRFLDVRMEKLEAGERPTEKTIDAIMDCDGAVVAAMETEAEAEAERVRLRGMAEAVGAKKDALQSLGAKLREEMRGSAWVLEQQRASRVQRDEG